MNRIILLVCLLLQTSILFAQQRKITGEVTDGNESIPGVTVMVKGSSNGTITNIDGKFEINAATGDILTFSFIGMETQEFAVGNQNTINVVLKSDQEELDEVVVVGYTTRKKGTATGALTTVGEDAMEVPVVSFDQALQGKVSGMSVMTSSGQPGSTSSVRIRGVNSINAGSSPLYIMDGIPITAGDFAALNPNDIENVTVLKDASSTSIYGARAANGVIVITTKRGKKGEKAKITYSGRVGFSDLAYGKWDLMNTTEKLDYEEMVGLRTPGAYDRAALEAVNVDWRDVLYNDDAFTTSHDLTLSGAGENSNYYVSLGYLEQEGIAPASGIERYSMRINLSTNPRTWFKAGFNTTLGYTESTAPNNSGNNLHNPSHAVYRLNPYYNPYNEDGSISDETFYENYGKPNPLATANDVYQNNNHLKLITSGFLEVKPIKQLSLKTQVGMDGYDSRSTNKVPPSLAVQNGSGNVSESFSRSYNITMTNLATYKNTFADRHNLTFLLGQEAIASVANGFGASGDGFTDDRLMILDSAPTQYATGGSVSKSNFLSFFTRAEYNYDYKYYLDLSYRRDGSSRFGEDNKWANFWSVGFMWDVKKENFLANVRPLNSLQVSLNAGTSGNSSIGNYEHLAMLASGPIYNGETGMGFASLGNPDLTWENVLSYNLGIKSSFYNRFSLNVEMYHKKTTDMLLSVPVSVTSGFTSQRQNVGEMTNSGIEIELNADILKKTAFKWSVSANIGYNKNKITKLYGDTDEYVIGNSRTKLTVGESLGSFYIVRFAGVDPENGDPLWYTKDGGITNQYSTDNSVLLDKTYLAPLTGGFTTTFSFKGISLQAFFSWVDDKYMINNTRYYTESNGRFAQDQQSRKMFDAWTSDNRYTDVPKYGNPTEFDDRLLENASFMRLKNLTVSWDMPKRWLTSRTNDVLSGVRFYAQAQNLFTWTGYSGLDPEVDSNVQLGSYPASRTFLFGVDITF